MSFKDGVIEAEYSDGFVANENMPYVDSSITMNMAILSQINEKQHGRMKRFSMYFKNNRIDVDWTKTPIGSKPIRIKNMSRKLNFDNPFTNSTEMLSIEFGYEYSKAILVRKTKVYKI